MKPFCEDLSLIRYTVYGLLEGSTPNPAVVSEGRHGQGHWEIKVVRLCQLSDFQ